MAVNPMLASGVNGITQAIQAQERVLDIANDGVDSGTRQPAMSPHREPDVSSVEADETSSSHHALSQLAHDLVDQKLYQRQVQASAQVIQTADEVLGFLVDVRV